MRIGVLALQGSFAEHIQSFRRLGVSATEVRLPQDLDGLHGLVIPGGESTTISHLLDEYALLSPLSRMIAAGFPVWGTCAGMILLARRSRDTPLPTLAAIDIAVKRNGWGRQVDSYETEIDVPALGSPRFRAVFIRPPIITDLGPQVNRLAQTDDGAVVAIRQGNVLATAFHPELTADLRFHDYFVQITRAAGTEAAQTKDIALTTS
ncbi:MAG TPA: pyridoxal 5'-phosphate synthase glutaminase subunit PdxT [Dehalococcoidia bacterium]|nr:pyridoxal 5'-phosphate synthase glutaminase subunit PdxT [Dehalococcoidia bacterium]